MMRKHIKLISIILTAAFLWTDLAWEQARGAAALTAVRVGLRPLSPSQSVLRPRAAGESKRLGIGEPQAVEEQGLGQPMILGSREFFNAEFDRWLCVIAREYIRQSEVIDKRTKDAFVGLPDRYIKQLVESYYKGRTPSMGGLTLTVQRLHKAGIPPNQTEKLLQELQQRSFEIMVDAGVERILSGEEETQELFRRSRWSPERAIYGLGKVRASVPLALSKAVNGVVSRHIQQGDAVIIDVGPGEGWLETVLPPAWIREGRIVPFDISHHFLDRIKARGLCRQAIQGSIYELSRYITSADAIMASDSFDTFDDLQAAVNECYKSLKPGGKLIVFQTLTADPKPIYEEAKEKGYVYCWAARCFFTNRAAAQQTMRHYIRAQIKGSMGDISDPDYQQFLLLREKHSLEVNTAVFKPKLTRAMRNAGFNILQEECAPAVVVTGINRHHCQLQGDDAITTVDPEYRVLNYKYGSLSLSEKQFSIPPGHVIERAEIIAIVAQKPVHADTAALGCVLRPRAAGEKNRLPELLTIDGIYAIRQDPSFGSTESRMQCLDLIEERIAAIGMLLHGLGLPDDIYRDYEQKIRRNFRQPLLQGNLKRAHYDLGARINSLQRLYRTYQDGELVQAAEILFLKTYTEYLSKIDWFFTYLAYSGITETMYGNPDKLRDLSAIYRVSLEVTYLVKLYTYAANRPVPVISIEPTLIEQGFMAETSDIMEGVDLSGLLLFLMRGFRMELEQDRQRFESQGLPRGLEPMLHMPSREVFLCRSSIVSLFFLFNEAWKNAISNFFKGAGTESPCFDISLEIKGNVAELAFENNRVDMNRQGLEKILLPGVTSKRGAQRKKVFDFRPPPETYLAGGLGLGLAKVTHTAAMMGAEMKIYARGRDRQTYILTFEDGLPVVRNAPPAEIEGKTGFKLVISLPGAYTVEPHIRMLAEMLLQRMLERDI